jgi:hypothetical protein
VSDFLISDLRQERDRTHRLADEVTSLRLRVQADTDNSGLVQRLADTEGAHRTSQDRIARLENDLGRHEHLRSVASGPSNREAGVSYEGGTHPAGVEASERRSAAFNEAQSVLESHVRSAELSSVAAERVDELLRGPDLHIGADAQYVAAVGQRSYAGAFGKLLQYGTMAPGQNVGGRDRGSAAGNQGRAVPCDG